LAFEKVSFLKFKFEINMAQKIRNEKSTRVKEKIILENELELIAVIEVTSIYHCAKSGNKIRFVKHFYF
jgi:hypothetical protein